MIPPAFASPGRFFRGNLHMHSTLSDGAADPEEICRSYKEEGYDFVSLTDHFTGQFGYPIADTSGFREDGFTTIPGAELHSGAMENGDLWHILAVGLPPDFPPPHAPGFAPVAGQESGPELARRAREAGAFVVLAHPQWSGLSMKDARSLDAAHAVEVYNHECALSSDRPDGFHMLELLLSEGRRLSLVASDDAHCKLADQFGGWVMVKAHANEPDLLLQALKDGAFYASQGPELHHIELVGEEIRIACSKVKSIIVQGNGTGVRARHGHGLTSARIPLERFRNSAWIRVSIVDEKNRRAWSNPIWL